MSPQSLSLLFFVQIVVILITCRVVGVLAKHLGQPQVMAEMIAGVLLGPSVFHLMAPEWQQQLFPAASRPILYSVSQLGLSLYMFLVGLEFRTDLFRSHLRRAAAVSLAGMLAPFVLGAGVACWMMRSQGRYFAPEISLAEAGLYLGASMCITAFPMLARIIVDRKLSGTELGTLSLAAGAINDGAAWCLLALVLASAQANWNIVIIAVGGGVGFTLLLLTAVRSLLSRWAAAREPTEQVSPLQLSAVLLLVMLAALSSEWIGVHAVFGAFMLGCAMPRGKFADDVTRQIDPLVSSLLLPLFFTYSGLNTRLDLVVTPELWLAAVLVLLAACLGKGGACWAAARWSGADQPTSLAIGALMNARGLMELIILNIGLEHGLITPELFSIMVVMAIVTTLMASPVFEWVYGRQARARGQLGSL